MAYVTITESQYVRDLGEMVLGTLEQVSMTFEHDADEMFTGQEISDFLYESAVALQAKFQARIDALEAPDGE